MSLNGPIGTRETRVQKAVYWYFVDDKPRDWIAERLNVSEDTVDTYLKESPQSEDVRQMLDQQAMTARMLAVEELRRQLSQAAQEAQSAEKPVEVWQNDDDELVVREKTNDKGEVVDRFPVPQDYELAPDGKTRYFRRQEAREILDLLCEITGAKEPEKVSVDAEVEHTGSLEADVEIPSKVVDAVTSASGARLAGGETDDSADAAEREPGQNGESGGE